jgi:hypothetical protein
MSLQSVTIASGGHADWSTPVRIDDAQLQASYQGIFVCRFSFESAGSHYLKMRIVGVDEMDNAGEVPSGFGALEFQDADGDLLRGRTDWFRSDDRDQGTWTFNSGTGKWAGATGRVSMLLNYMSDVLGTSLPPSGPIRFVGFIEGSGEIDVPALSS